MNLISELRALRKGRGVFAGQVDRRVGPALREACGITDRDGPGAVRRKVQARLTELITQLPSDLRMPTMAAFALEADARFPLYQDRVHWVAEKIERDPRTVRRRVDDAIDQLAELADSHPGALGAWHTSALRVAAVFDLHRPEVLVHRTVVADQDGVRELPVLPPLPTPWHELEVRVVYGGTLVGPVLALPAPLPRGAAHDFAVTFRLRSARAAPPHLVCVPAQPCDLLDVRVRFGRDRAAPRVWALSGTYHRDRSDIVHHGSPHPVDDAGEVHLRVRGLMPGLAYGLRWDAGEPRGLHPCCSCAPGSDPDPVHQGCALSLDPAGIPAHRN